MNNLCNTEFKEFGKYLHSPFFNESEGLVKLYELFNKHYPGINAQVLCKKELFGILYPDESYNDKKLTDRLSSMLKHAEDYLAFSALKKDKTNVLKWSLKVLGEKNLDKHFDSKLRELLNQIEKQSLEYDDYLFHLYDVKNQMAKYYINKESLGRTTKFSGSLIESMNVFTLFSVVTILKHAVTMINIRHHVVIDFNDKVFDWVIKVTEDKFFLEYPVIKLLRGLILLSKSNSESEYFSLKDLLFRSKEVLHPEEQRVISIELYNYSKRRALAGSKKFQKENFAFMKKMVKMGAYSSEQGYMTESAYLSFASQAMAEKDFVWAERFVTDYKDKVSPARRENAHTYISSILNYHKGNHDRALRGLSKVIATDFYYLLRTKNYTTRIFFELGEYEQTIRNINSFRAYLSTNQNIPPSVKERFSRFLCYLDRMVRAIMESDKFKLVKLKRELRTNVQTENKSWLLEQIEKAEPSPKPSPKAKPNLISKISKV